MSVAELRNPDTGAAFYVTQHEYTPSGTVEKFTVKVNTSEGARMLSPLVPISQ